MFVKSGRYRDRMTFPRRAKPSKTAKTRRSLAHKTADSGGGGEDDAIYNNILILLLQICNYYRGSGWLRPRGWQSARGDRGSVQTVKMRTRDRRRCPLRLRSTTSVSRETFDRQCAEHVCYCRVVSPSGRSVGRWWLRRGGNRIYRARGSCAAAAFSPHPSSSIYTPPKHNRWSRRGGGGGGRRPVVTTATASSSPS